MDWAKELQQMWITVITWPLSCCFLAHSGKKVSKLYYAKRKTWVCATQKILKLPRPGPQMHPFNMYITGANILRVAKNYKNPWPGLLCLTAYMESSVGVSSQGLTTRLAHGCLMWLVALFPHLFLYDWPTSVWTFLYDLLPGLEMRVWTLGAAL